MEAPREPLTDLPSSPHGPRALRVVTVGLVAAVVAFVVVVGFLSVEAVRRPDVGASLALCGSRVTTLLASARAKVTGGSW